MDKQIPTVIIGGSVKMTTDASIGGGGFNQINQLHLIVPLSEWKVDEGYCNNPDMEEGAVGELFCEMPNKPMSWADSSKIGQSLFR